MITGYFINEKTPFKEFVKRKFRTLIVPYFITGIVILILGTITGFFNQGSVDAFMREMDEKMYEMKATHHRDAAH